MPIVYVVTSFVRWAYERCTGKTAKSFWACISPEGVALTPEEQRAEDQAFTF